MVRAEGEIMRGVTEGSAGAAAPFASGGELVAPPGIEVLGELGRGAQAVVYRARREGRDYALKLLRVTGPGRDAGAQLRREAAALVRVAHPGLARVHDVGSVHGQPYLVVELVAGQTLAAVVRGGPLPEAVVATIGIDVAGALAAAHRFGLVHRDVKPHNIMVQPDGRAKIIDFGLAARVDARLETAAGTFAYVAPEQTGMLSRLVDGRSDLYALGVVLYQCVTGELPFVAEDVGELLRLHAVAAAPDPRTVLPEVSAQFAALIGKLLAKDPDDRYQRGADLIADLLRLRSSGRGDADAGFAVGGRDVPGLLTEVPDRPVEGEMLGRDAELAKLTGAWRSATGGTGAVCLIRGGAGTGKTRLVEELCRCAAAGGGLVLRGGCRRENAAPLAPLRQAVDAYLRELGRLAEPARSAAVGRVLRVARPLTSLLGPLSPLLTGLIGPTVSTGEETQDQFAGAVAVFLAGIVRQSGSAVLHLDDVEWLDPGTRRVIGQLAAELADTPLLVVATTRDDPEQHQAVAALEEELGEAVTVRMELTALDDETVSRLVAGQLTGAAVPADLTAQIVTRSGGNPFMAVEYLRAIVDDGLVYPSWGAWRFDQAAFDALDLADDALDLVVKRVAGLDPVTRTVLTAAAAVGVGFDPTLLAAVSDVDQRDVFTAIDVATRRRLIGPHLNNRQVFLHDRIPHTLLDALDPAARKALHQRIAGILDAANAAAASTDPDDIYAVAGQYLLGETDRDPRAVLRACHAAGTLALSQHAAQQAVEFLEAAAKVAEVAGLTLDPEFLRTLGVAYLEVGWLDAARSRLAAAIAAEPDRMRRAALHKCIADVYLADWGINEAIAATGQGMAELGRQLPGNPLVLLASSLSWFVAGLVVGKVPRLFGTATGEQRERFRLEALLLETMSRAVTKTPSMLTLACLILRGLFPANRLGPSPEYVRQHANLATTAQRTGQPRRAQAKVAELLRLAERLGDPRLAAAVKYGPVIVDLATNKPNRVNLEKLRRLVSEEAKWFDLDTHLGAVGVGCGYLIFRGHAADAVAWYSSAGGRKVTGADIQANPVCLLLPTPLAMLGRDAEARQRLREAREFLTERTEHWQQWVQYLVTAFGTAVELDELNESFEDLVADLRRMGITRQKAWPVQHILWIYLAYGRLEQCRTATPQQLPARLAAAKRAIKDTRGLAKHGLHVAHRTILNASYEHLTGNHNRALRLLQQAETRSHGQDAPTLNYEIARLRARVLTMLGHHVDAHQYACTALAIATQHQWVHRTNWIRAEFDLADISHRSGSTRGGYDSTITHQTHRRRLDALQQVSLTAAKVLDPQQLARVVLDETIRIFGAERAFLFLVDEDTRQLLPDAGRDNTGADLTELTGYSTTFVERVRDGADALVMTTDSDGRTVSSHSALVHGLRSVMVAPLRLKDRLLGVVYLDSRVAKGIFTSGDVDMLAAITNHVAISLETARAAQLEVAVHAARRQRDLAETLRSAVAEFSSTLDPDDVLRRMLTVVTRAMRADSACLLRAVPRSGPAAGGVLTVAMVTGDGPVEAAGTQVDPVTDPVLMQLADGPLRGTADADRPAPLPELLPRAASWIALPLSTPDTPVGALLVGATCSDAYTDTDTDILVALAGQAMVAYDKARLFDRVRQMATQDSLTGVANRRHLLEKAEQRFAAADPAHGGLSIVMIDIDHFKKINDTHGHQAGDDVIREVAHRLHTALRPGHLLGRYGGEEFMIVISADPATATDIAECLRTTVEATAAPTLIGPVPVTVSVGVGHLHTDNTDNTDLGALIGRADRALYTAKKRGRNLVVAL
jgi:diguanylate cyclase (GGDEF)-like protein